MKASVENQRAALELSRVDNEISKINHQISQLPELVEIKSATSNFNNSRDLRIAAETELKDVQRELTRAESDVEQIVTRIERDEQRLNSGQGGAKELEQLQHELGTLANRRKELEEIELDIMVRADDIKVRIAALSAEEKAAQERIGDAEIRKENAMARLSGELATFTTERAAIVTKVGSELIAIYEKVRADRGVGAAALSEGKCMGCNLAINAVELARIKGLSDDEVVRCEECRCILVRGA